MKNLTLSLLAVFVLAGCAGPQTLVSQGPAAKLVIDLNSDSVGTNAKVWRVSKFDDETCSADDKGTLIARQLFGNSGGTLEPIPLPVGEKITLGFGYIEARFAQNRECSYALTFKPEENEKYTAKFAVSNNSQACKVSLIDSAGRSVDKTTPVKSCVVGLMGKINNGQPGVLDWKITVNVVRVP